MKPTVYLKAPTGAVRKVEGAKLANSLLGQGWTHTEERPKAKPARTHKPGTYYVNTNTLSGW